MFFVFTMESISRGLFSIHMIPPVLGVQKALCMYVAPILSHAHLQTLICDVTRFCDEFGSFCIQNELYAKLDNISLFFRRADFMFELLSSCALPEVGHFFLRE